MRVLGWFSDAFRIVELCTEDERSRYRLGAAGSSREVLVAFRREDISWKRVGFRVGLGTSAVGW